MSVRRLKIVLKSSTDALDVSLPFPCPHIGLCQAITMTKTPPFITTYSRIAPLTRIVVRFRVPPCRQPTKRVSNAAEPKGENKHATARNRLKVTAYISPFPQALFNNTSIIRPTLHSCTVFMSQIEKTAILEADNGDRPLSVSIRL